MKSHKEGHWFPFTLTFNMNNLETPNPLYLHVFRWWGEAGVPGESPCWHSPQAVPAWAPMNPNNNIYSLNIYSYFHGSKHEEGRITLHSLLSVSLFYFTLKRWHKLPSPEKNLTRTRHICPTLHTSLKIYNDTDS